MKPVETRWNSTIDWKKKALGIALIYLAPHALKFVREKLEDYQKQETIKSLNKVI